MNSFADIKDQVIESLQATWLQIQENDTFISLKEKFDNLPQHYQTLVKVFTALFAVYLVYSIPADIMTESKDKEAIFVENRQMTRDIIKAARLGRSLQVPPPAPKGAALKSIVSSTIRKQRVLPEQIKPLAEESGIAGKKLVSKKVEQSGVIAKTRNLNLRQVVNVAQDIDGLTGVRLINMILQSDKKDPHLFNVDFELASFSVPEDKTPVESKKSKKKKKKKKGKR